MHLLDLHEKVHNNLNVFYFLPGLYFAVVSEAILIGEDWFGVFGHHNQPNFVLQEIKVELRLLEILEVLLVPRKGKQSSDQLELE